MASVHKALEDLSPEKVEVFEGWFSPSERERLFHIAPVTGALSYLRRDRELYVKVMERAGRYASQWSYLDRSPVERKVLTSVPGWLKGSLVRYVLKSGLRQVHRDFEMTVHKERECFVVTVTNSLFCRTGGSTPEPLCSFYASLFAGLLDRTGLARPPVVESACRAQGKAACRFEAAR